MATKESKTKTACSEQDERIQKFEQSIGLKLFDYQKEMLQKMIDKPPTRVLYGGQRNCCESFLIAIHKYIDSLQSKDWKEGETCQK